ncbi:SEC-C metal-binding domain-containing protein [Streptococcus anginosus]|uniref:SEC-C metal-binding domain-containing protein n=1 Tax=Streptococcus anginosus TaxID=1328 RepID=UPI0040424DC6
MTQNEFILCSTCKLCINLRIQMGNFPVDFALNCPECETEITGRVGFEPFDITLTNAQILDKDVPDYDQLTDFPIWCLEISAEFPTRKLYLRESPFDRLAPFMAHMARMSKKDDLTNIKKFQNTSIFADFIRDKKLDNFKRLYNLYWNRQDKYLYPELNRLLSDYKGLTIITDVKNSSDAAMALHQLFLTTSGINFILGENTLSEYTELSNHIYKSEQHREELLKYSNYIASNFDMIEKTAFDKITVFAKIYPILVPVVTLMNVGNYENLNQDEYGISTANYKELNEFYASSYEWILDNINLVIALNNIFERDSYNECYNGKKYIDDLEQITNKFQKINQNNPEQSYLNISEQFSKPVSSLNNKIRNAIQHYSSHVNVDNQEIIFEDKYGGRVRIEKYSIVDFAKLCIINFSLIFYILEIVYTLRKLKLITDGVTPTIYWTKNEEISKVMSSNEVGSNRERKLKNRIKKKRKKK